MKNRDGCQFRMVCRDRLRGAQRAVTPQQTCRQNTYRRTICVLLEVACLGIFSTRADVLQV